MQQRTTLARPTALALIFTMGTLSLAVGCVDEVLLEPSSANSKKDPASPVVALSNVPTILDSKLAVRTVVSGLSNPIGMAFIGANDFLFLERSTGRVRRVTNGIVLTNPVLDLPVNSGGSHGLLSIALHPAFPANAGVYLFWTESSTGVDTQLREQTPLLGNRVDRYHWNGSTLSHERTLIRVRALEWDAGQTVRSNHDGGVLRFGPDGKLYIFVGDVGRRSALQNLRCGPTNRYDCPPAATVADDEYGGPQPDNAHLTGVILRLNDDGTTPTDNPFYSVGANIGGEVGANVQRIFSYGHRNSFGMAFDPKSGNLWLQENGDDAFAEINRVPAGMNGGWIQIMGPLARVAQFKQIETTQYDLGLRRTHWLPGYIADTPAEAAARLYAITGSNYVDPQLSWKYDVAPGGMAFIDGSGLGSGYDGHLVVGAGLPTLEGGYLFNLPVAPGRTALQLSDSRLSDGVADNVAKHEITESESLLFGQNFGVTTDLQTGPNGNLFVISLTLGAIYEIYQAPSAPVAAFTYACNRFTCSFDGRSSSGNGISSYAWRASTGQTASGETAILTFTSRGKITVTLTVTNSVGQGSTSKALKCGGKGCS